MPAEIRNPIFTLWILWGVYWSLAAISVKATARRESPMTRLGYTLPILIAVWLLLVGPRYGWLFMPILPRSAALYGIGVVLLAAGLAFSIWARICLGRNWSASVAVKRQHELIRHGPYAWVRHPIYTGILAAFVGTVLAENQWCYVIAFVIITVALRFKWRLEETWMQETFGEAYADYRRQVPAIIPQPWRH